MSAIIFCEKYLLGFSYLQRFHITLMYGKNVWQRRGKGLFFVVFIHFVKVGGGNDAGRKCDDCDAKNR